MTSAAVTSTRHQFGVRAEQVVRTFGGRTVLDHLDLTIDDEELVVLLGPSGCGKSTLLRLLAGLDRPNGGRIEVPAKRAIVFQGDRLLPWQRVLRNVTIGLRGRDADQRARKNSRVVKRSAWRWRVRWWPNRS
jgi:sulfonate transport system ATP-binding protein